MIRGILISRSKSQKSPKIEKDGSRQSESVKKRFGVSGDVLSTSSLSSSSTNWLTSNSSIDHGPQMPDLLVDHVTDKMRRSSVGESFTTASSSLIRQISTRLPKRLKTRFRKPSEEEQQQQNLIANDISLESGISTLTNRAFSIIVSGCGDPHDLQDDYKSNNISEDLEIMAANLEVNRFLPQDSLESNMDQSTEKRLKWSGAVLKRAMIANAPKLIADRKLSNAVNAYSSPRSFKNCMIGTEMVDWLISYSNKLVSNRLQVVGAWQALLESGVICHATNEHFFNDKYLFYRWSEEDCTILNNEHQSSKIEDHNLPSSSNSTTSKDQDFVVALGFLLHVGTDALFRMILRKSPKERTPEEIDVVFDEMLNIKAFTNLSTLVKRELASVMMFEQYQNTGTILFRQGDKGKSWYVIVKGSVNVIIHNKGTVCTLKEGDDFGKLALVNDAPRAATIVLNENNAQFLRVDKDDFNRILRDVEANTVRLKEHDKDVLVLEKVVFRSGVVAGTSINKQMIPHRYSVMAGTPEKMLEYLLETRIDCEKDEMDTFMDDFLLTYLAFGLTNSALCSLLSSYLHPKIEENLSSQNKEQAVNRRRVIFFLQQWIDTAGLSFFQDPANVSFVEEIYSTSINEPKFPTCSNILESIMLQREKAMRLLTRSPIVVLDKNFVKDLPEPMAPVAPTDIASPPYPQVDIAYLTNTTPKTAPTTSSSNTSLYGVYG